MPNTKDHGLRAYRDRRSRFKRRDPGACRGRGRRGNELLIDGDRLSGAVGEPILGPESKLAALTELAGRRGLALAATAAVGDGANDLDMVRAAGLGVAYRGQPMLRRAARFRIDHGDLTAPLYLQGYRRDEFME